MQVLESRLVEKMRFELGAIYNVSAGVDFSISHAAAGQPIKGNASVSYTCEPGQVAALAALVLNELALLKAHGPAEEEVAKRAEISRRAHETDVKYNSWWLERLTTSFTVRCYTGSVRWRCHGLISAGKSDPTNTHHSISVCIDLERF